ncbi:MAG: enoyl-CoA hydratase-related protein [Negativicutes bacterium]
MKEFKTLLFENQDGLGILTMNRPAALNALNRETMEELLELLSAVKADTTVKVLIITGAEKAFVAGADIKEMLPMTAAEGQAWGRLGQSVFSLIENLPQAVIAAINGFALGGGCELAMACDIRIASEKAKFGQPEVSLGIIPGFCGTQRLPRLVGKGIAKELTYTGDMIDAQEALRIGLVNKVTTPEELLLTAKAMAGRIMQKGLFAVQMAKIAINNGLNTDIETGSVLEATLFGVTCATEDKKEGMTAFVEKRKPMFPGA